MQGGVPGALMPVVFTSTLVQVASEQEDAAVSAAADDVGLLDLEGSVYGITQTPQVWLDHRVSEQEGVLEAVNGKIDAFIYDMPYNAAAISQRGQGKLVHLDRPFTYEPLAWAVRKGDFDFVNWLNNFMNQVKNDGTYEQIYHKWFVDDSWMKELQ